VDLHCLGKDLAVSDLWKREHGEHLNSYKEVTWHQTFNTVAVNFNVQESIVNVCDKFRLRVM
jgi:hypothetical protein